MIQKGAIIVNELKNTAKLVKNILEIRPKARNSDDYLYFLVCHTRLKSQGFDIRSVSLSDALLHRKFYQLPAFETVRRARQKIQAENIELAASGKVQEIRSIKEEVFREFAKG